METKKELTAADLRVGQKVWVEINDNEPDFATHIVAINQEHYGITVTNESGVLIGIKLSEMKPILRRFESMTESESKKYKSLCWEQTYEYSSSDFNETIESVLWLVKNNFDVMGWIDAGLAVDAATLKGETNG